MTVGTTLIFDIIGRETASAAFARAGAAADAASAKITTAGRRMTAVGSSLTRSVTLPVAALGVVSGKMATDFNSAMTRIQTQAGASAKDVKVLTDQVLELAGKAQQSPLELANSLYHLKSVGLDNVKAMAALKQASDLAAVGNADLEQTTNALAGAWRTGIKGAGNFNQAVATLNAVIGAGNMTMGDLNAAIGTGFLPAAKSFGLSLKDVGSALAVMTDEGVPAAAAATRLRMSFSLLGAPSAAAQKILQGIGISANELGHTLRSQGLVGAIGLLKDHMQGLNKVAQAQTISRAFGGGRSGAAIMTLVNNFDVLQQKEAQVRKGMGRFGAAVAKQAKTPQAQFKLLISTLEVAAIKIGNQLLPATIKAAHGLNSFIGWFSKLPGPVKAGSGAFVLFLAVLGPVLSITGRLVTGVGYMVKAFTLLRDAALLTRAQLAALWVQEKIGAAVTKAVAAAQWLLNAAMDANPIGLVVIALAALAAGLIYAYKHSETFRNIVNGAFHAVASTAKAVFGWIKDAAEAAFNWVKGHWKLLAAILGGPIVAAVIVITSHWSKIKAGAANVFGFIKSVFGKVFAILTAPFRTAIAVISNAWDAYKAAGMRFFNWISGLPGKIKAALGNLSGLLVSVGHNIIAGLWNGLSDAWGRMMSWLSDKINSLSGIAKKILGIHSPSTVFRKIGQNLMDGLLQGISDRQMTVQKAVERVAGLIKKVGDKISGLMSTRKGFMGTFSADSVFGADLSTTTTDALGNDVTTPGTIASALDYQKQQAAQARALLRDVRSVTKMGLSKALVRQLQSQGTAGAATLHALATGDPAQIRQLNRLNRQTSDSLRRAGLRAGNYVRGGSIGDDIRTARRQQHVLELLEKRLKELADNQKKDQTIIVEIDGEAVIRSIKRRNHRKGVKNAGV